MGIKEVKKVTQEKEVEQQKVSIIYMGPTIIEGDSLITLQ